MYALIFTVTFLNFFYKPRKNNNLDVYSLTESNLEYIDLIPLLNDGHADFERVIGFTLVNHNGNHGNQKGSGVHVPG